LVLASERQKRSGRRRATIPAAVAAYIAQPDVHIIADAPSACEGSRCLSQIDRTVHDLIDRLARLDLARPQHDKPAIEQAVARLLALFRIDDRPCSWADDPLAAYRQVAATEVLGHSVRQSSYWMGTAMQPFEEQAARAAGLAGHSFDVVSGSSILITGCIALIVAAALAQGELDIVRIAIIVGSCAIPVALLAVGRIAKARDRAKAAAAAVAWSAAVDAAELAAKDATGDTVWNDLEHAVLASGRDARRSAVAVDVAPADAEVADGSSGKSAAGAVLAAWHTPIFARAWAVGAIAAYQASIAPTQGTSRSMAEHMPSYLRAFGRASVHAPIFDAFAAGLFLGWITPNAVVCLLKPALWTEHGRLHRADGPAVLWPSGAAYHFWHGTCVPAWLIEQPSRLSVALIRAEPDPEVRGCMVQVYGLERFLGDIAARLVHEDEIGRLWQARVPEQTWTIVAELVFDSGRHRVVCTLDGIRSAEEPSWSVKEMRDLVSFPIWEKRSKAERESQIDGA
jgi:hypothetical protein